jgi:hypothetical protein
MELEATWGRTTRVWWAYLWRNLIAMLVGTLLGAVVGAVLGFVLGAAGVAPDVIRRLSFVIGVVLGLGVSIVPMRMILGKSFGEFRLVLVSVSGGQPASAGLPR